MRRAALLTALVAAALAGATAAGAAPPAAGGPCSLPDPGLQVRQVGRYVVTLKVGPVPRMYTAAQARQLKPTTGVVMLEPMQAVAGGSMQGGAGQRHLRVQVCDAATGKPLRTPRPKAEVTAGMNRFAVPLTLGYDAGRPATEWRFCNTLRVGDEALSVGVAVGGELAAFSVLPGA